MREASDTTRRRDVEGGGGSSFFRAGAERWAPHVLNAARAVVGLSGLAWVAAAPVDPVFRPILLAAALLTFLWLLVNGILFLRRGALPIWLREWAGVLDCLLVSPFLVHTRMQASPFLIALCTFALVWSFSSLRRLRLITPGCASLLGALAALLAGGPLAAVLLRGLTLPALCGVIGWQARRLANSSHARRRLLERIRSLWQRLHDQAQTVEAMHERVLQSERLAAVGQMAVQIAHQVRNPLTSLSLNTELLGDYLQALPEPRRSEALSLVEAMSAELDLLVDLTENYLGFAKLPPIERRPGSLNRVVADLLKLLRSEISRQRVELNVELDPGVPALPIDARQLRSAFVNLIRNAVESMPEGGRLRVETVSCNGYVDVQVADTGRGVPIHERDRIFDMFYTTKERGTGLGLSYVKRIVEAHRGTVRCESTAGVGSLFVVRFPRELEEEHGTGAEADTGR